MVLKTHRATAETLIFSGHRLVFHPTISLAKYNDLSVFFRDESTALISRITEKAPFASDTQRQGNINPPSSHAIPIVNKQKMATPNSPVG